MHHFPGVWVRFGGLSPVEQKQFDSSFPTFHSPPRRRGLYAYTSGYVDPFLIGSTCEVGHQSNKAFRLRVEGQLVDFDSHCGDEKWDAPLVVSKWLRRKLSAMRIKTRQLLRGEKGEIVVLRKPRIFKHHGFFWHHLGRHAAPVKVIETAGSWVLTTFETWKDCFAKEKHALTRLTHREHFNLVRMHSQCLHYDPFRKLEGAWAGWTSYQLEVFVERL